MEALIWIALFLVLLGIAGAIVEGPDAIRRARKRQRERQQVRARVRSVLLEARLSR